LAELQIAVTEPRAGAGDELRGQRHLFLRR
jgi:hypothetical protein